MQKDDKKVGILFIALCIFLWSLIPIVTKSVHSSLDHHQFLFYSSIFSFLSLFFIALFQKSLGEIFSYSKQSVLMLFALGFLDFLYYLLLYFGYLNANGLEVLVVQYMWPIFIVLLSPFLLHERLTKRKIFALFFGFLGVFLTFTKGDFSSVDFSNWGVLFVVMLGTFSFALFSVLSKKISTNPTNAVMIYFFSAILYSFVSMRAFSSFVFPSTKDFLAIFVNGVFLNGISYLFWVKGLKIFHASKIAPYIFIIPVLAAFFMIFIYNEPILKIYFAGLFFVILSGLINAINYKI
ncbi:MAG: permease [Proteobacteria bacterium]|nr:MAG: permease [Pseudomonadota bacterium]